MEPDQKGIDMTQTTTGRRTFAGSELEDALAHIEKGQQLAGHFPDAEDLDRARRILEGKLTPEEAREETRASVARMIAESREHVAGR